jgi:hypothetical protein
VSGLGLCRDCGGQVRFVRGYSRPWLVLDPEPNAMGDVAIDDYERGLILGPGDRLKDSAAGSERFIRHYQTCPARARLLRRAS